MKRQLALLLWIRVIRMFLITMPIIVIYWQSHGLTMQDIFVLQVVFAAAVIAFEVPSGYFADRIGRKQSMILGSIFGIVGFWCYWALPSYGGFLAAEIILALSGSFFSGARDALVYETLKTHGKEKEFTKHQGRIFAAGNVAEAIAAVLAGVVVSLYSIETVLLIQWIILIPTLLLSLLLTEQRSNGQEQTPNLLEILHGNFRRSPKLLLLNLYAGCVGAATLTMVWFAQPHWKVLEIDILYFGYIWAALNGIVAVGAIIAHTLEKHLRFRTLFAGLALMPALLYFGLALEPSWIIVLVLTAGFWLHRGIMQPIIQDYVQRECSDGDRATTLSINALMVRLVFAIFSPFLGWATDTWSFEMAYLCATCIFGSIALISFLFLYREMKRV